VGCAEISRASLERTRQRLPVTSTTMMMSIRRSLASMRVTLRSRRQTGHQLGVSDQLVAQPKHGPGVDL
jgi:hypothetical protein